MNHRKGLSLIETSVALMILMLVGGALVSFSVGAIATANSSRMRAQATRLAQQRMETIKQIEQDDKISVIQPGDWSTFSSHVTLNETDLNELDFGKYQNFFTRNTSTANCSGTSCTVEVKVTWTYRGVAPNCTIGSEKNCVRLTTTVTRWL